MSILHSTGAAAAVVGQPPVGMGRREWALLLLLSTFWGGSFLFNEVALRGLPHLTIILCRVGLGGLLVSGAVLATGRRLPVGWAVWRLLLVVGLLNNALPFFLLVWAQSHITAGLAAILNATTPLWTVLVAHGTTADEKLTPAKLAGVALGFTGVVVAIGGEALAGVGDAVLAELACLAASLAYAAGTIVARRLGRFGLVPASAASGQLLAAAALILPAALLVDRPWRLPPPPAASWAAVAAIALLSTALAYILYYRLLAKAGATNVSLVTFLVPLTTIWFGWLLLEETLAWRHVAGVAFIGAGLLLLNSGLVRRALQRRTIAEPT